MITGLQVKKCFMLVERMEILWGAGNKASPPKIPSKRKEKKWICWGKIKNKERFPIFSSLDFRTFLVKKIWHSIILNPILWNCLETYFKSREFWIGQSVFWWPKGYFLSGENNLHFLAVLGLVHFFLVKSSESSPGTVTAISLQLNHKRSCRN